VAVEELARAGREVAELVADHLGTVGDRRVWGPIDAADRAWLTDQPLPAGGRSLTELVQDVRTRVMPYPMGNGHPRFFGWVNSPPSPAGVLVEPLAVALNPSCAGGEHAGPMLERNVVRWLAELVGFPHPPGGGLLTSGASMATIVCLAAARYRAARRAGWDVREQGLFGQPPLVLYQSGESHSCVLKAAELLGIGRRNVRTIPVNPRFAMNTAALRATIADDIGQGLRPFCVCASAGTVNTGAIDALDDIAEIAEEFGLWFHVDGAYGALGVLAEQNRAAYAGLERADSLALDPHKWLGVPVDCGCALVQDPATLRDAFSFVPPYLRDEHADDLGWFAEYGIEQTRPFRALRAWATMAHLGRDGITRLVQHTTRLAHALAAMVENADDFELLAPVSASITVFVHRRPGDDTDRYDELNRQIPTAVQHRGRVFFTGTTLAGQHALRACFLNPATTEDDLLVLLDEIRSAAAQLPR
jgi:glutamate/tyrosine decarboxylase-like PLP-dependent enzyme